MPSPNSLAYVAHGMSVIKENSPSKTPCTDSVRFSNKVTQPVFFVLESFLLSSVKIDVILSLTPSARSCQNVFPVFASGVFKVFNSVEIDFITPFTLLPISSPNFFHPVFPVLSGVFKLRKIILILFPKRFPAFVQKFSLSSLSSVVSIAPKKPIIDLEKLSENLSQAVFPCSSCLSSSVINPVILSPSAIPRSSQNVFPVFLLGVFNSSSNDEIESMTPLTDLPSAAPRFSQVLFPFFVGSLNFENNPFIPCPIREPALVQKPSASSSSNLVFILSTTV